MMLKLQSGGELPPFADYTPIPSTYSNPFETGETSTQSKGKASGGIDLKDLLNLVKGLEGLPNDSKILALGLSSMFQRIYSPNSDVDNADIASMYSRFLSQLLSAKFNKEKYKEAFKKVSENGGLNEVAIMGNKLIGLNVETGQLILVDPKKLNELDDNVLLLTNSNLLAMRSLKLDMAFNNPIIDIVENGIGLETVNNLIKNAIGKLGSDTLSYEGYSKKDKDLIVAGIEYLKEAYSNGANLSGMSLDGLYKLDIVNETQARQIKKAINYIYTMLPTNAKTLLQVKTGSTLGILDTIYNVVGSNSSEKIDFNTTLIKDKNGKSVNGNSSSKEIQEKSNPYLQLIREEGGYEKPLNIVTKSGNLGIGVQGTWYGQLPKVNSDMSIDALLATGLLGIVENRDSITFGDLLIGSDKLKDILYDNKGGTVATLPIKFDINGNKIVNLNIINLYKKVLSELKNLEKLNMPLELLMLKWAELLKEELLDELIDPRTGLPNLNMFGLFLIVDAYTTDKILPDTKSEFVHKVKNPDEDLENKLIKGLSTDKDKSNYDVDINDTFLFEGFWDDIYKANLYIPIVNNPNAAINAWGDQWKEDNVSENELMYLNFNKLKSMKSTSSNVL